MKRVDTTRPSSPSLTQMTRSQVVGMSIALTAQKGQPQKTS